MGGERVQGDRADQGIRPTINPCRSLFAGFQIGKRIVLNSSLIRVKGWRGMMREGGIAALLLLSCQEPAKAITAELSSPRLAGCLCENEQVSAVECGVSGGGERTGTFELLPAEEESAGTRVAQKLGSAYLHASEVRLPEVIAQVAPESVPHAYIAVTVRTAGEIGEPIAITVCLAGLVVMGTGRKKSRATPGRRHAARTQIGLRDS